MNTAYNASIEFSLRMQKVLFPVVVATTLVASAMFSAAGLDKRESIYVLLGYLIVLQWIYDFAARRARIADAKTLEEEPDLQLPYFDDARPYVFIWLIWWVATILLFNAKIVYAHGLLAQLTLVTFVLLFVTLRYIVQLDYNNLWVSVLRGVLRFISLVLVFVPSKEWSPHHTSGLDSFVRVSAFFITIIALQVIINNYVERSTDILVMVWWILITPWHISLIVLALMLFIVFYSQTRRISFASLDMSAAAMQTMAPLSATAAAAAAATVTTTTTQSLEPVGASIIKSATTTSGARIVSTSTSETMSLPGVAIRNAPAPRKQKRPSVPEAPARSTLDGGGDDNDVARSSSSSRAEQRKLEAKRQNDAQVEQLLVDAQNQVALERLPPPPTALVLRNTPRVAVAVAVAATALGTPKDAQKAPPKPDISFV